MNSTIRQNCHSRDQSYLEDQRSTTQERSRQPVGYQREEEEVEVVISVEVGDEVEIIDGPFKSMIARVEQIDKKNKATVGVKMFGRTNNVDLKFTQVRQAPTSADKQ